jgi:hypothetical protein
MYLPRSDGTLFLYCKVCGMTASKQVQGQVILRLKVSRLVRIGVEPLLGPMTRF